MDYNTRILENFKTICKIPRGSGDEKAISDFLVKFAEDRGFKARQDESLNVIINMPGTCGMEDKPTVALQGHMDMVYVKTPDSPHVYADGIETKIEGDYMMSTLNTSLGADDGMAVAYCMTLMEDMTIPHPPLEILITVLEEVGLIGAKNLDCSSLKAKYFINLDSEKEGEFFISCAGGVRNLFTVPMGEKEEVKGLKYYDIRLSDLKGGHSGMDIDKGKGNGIKLLGRILKNCDSSYLHLCSFGHDGKANAIPHACSAKVGVETAYNDEFIEKLNSWFAITENEYKFSDTPKFAVEEASESPCYKNESKQKLYDAVALLPYGVVSRSFAIDGLIETSVNIGSCVENGTNIEILSSARSSVKSRKDEIIERIDLIAELLGCKSECSHDYPSWDYNPDSKLKNIAMTAYKNLTGKDGEEKAIHAGLECGYFHEKMPDCDMLSIGCDIYDVHSVKEKVSVSSFYSVFYLLLEILRNI